MAKAGSITSLWKNIARFFGWRGKAFKKKTRTEPDQLADEAPLHHDGAAGQLRSLREPFFEY